MIFAKNLGVPEGPVALDDGRWLVVEMAPERGCVTLLDQDGRMGRVIARTGRPNGLALDSDGTIWVAESREPSLIRLDMDGRSEVVLTACDGEPFLFPNDLCFGPDGNLYVAVYGQGDVTVLSPAGEVVERIETAGSLPTNVAFGLEEQRIYVTEDEFGRVEAFEVSTEELRLYT